MNYLLGRRNFLHEFFISNVRVYAAYHAYESIFPPRYLRVDWNAANGCNMEQVFQSENSDGVHGNYVLQRIKLHFLEFSGG